MYTATKQKIRPAIGTTYATVLSVLFCIIFVGSTLHSVLARNPIRLTM